METFSIIACLLVEEEKITVKAMVIVDAPESRDLPLAGNRTLAARNLHPTDPL